MSKELSFRRLVRPEDMNPAHRLFGGRIMEWADEAAALHAMLYMNTQSIVTMKVSEIMFTNPALNGDILEFWAETTKVGTKSITVRLQIERRLFAHNADKPKLILDCEFIFVHVDENGKSKPHGLREIK